MPLGAIIAKSSVMNWKPVRTDHVWRESGMSGGFAGNDGSLEGGMMENARKMGSTFSLVRGIGLVNSKIVGDVRGKGLMVGIEIVRDQRTKERAGDLRNANRGFCVSQRTAGVGAGENSCGFHRRF